uniref:PDZ domain-containing protein n=1 Tax=Lates calcarifer TaxID=8187 RepID=A0A4W6CBA1_LATCA
YLGNIPGIGWMQMMFCTACLFLLFPTLSVLCLLSASDYIIKEKTVLLQKKDSEGFGFVLRGAKAQTPIEEFTPTPAFPALQYLESVDEGGVAWRAGLRMGDFLIEVNGQNVVKVGHRQVVNMIRQGGNSLMVKVVMVTRNPDMEEGSRKKSNKRLSTPAIALRSKSMTSELEEMEGWGLLRMLKVRRGVERGLNLDSKKVEREIRFHTVTSSTPTTGNPTQKKCRHPPCAPSLTARLSLPLTPLHPHPTALTPVPTEQPTFARHTHTHLTHTHTHRRVLTSICCLGNAAVSGCHKHHVSVSKLQKMSLLLLNMSLVHLEEITPRIKLLR